MSYKKAGRDVYWGKKQHKKAQTENIDDLLVTLFLCAVQRCLILRSAKGAGQLAADTVS